eukprot:1137465-Pelagomonas_calceolata.AAC.3
MRERHFISRHIVPLPGGLAQGYGAANQGSIASGLVDNGSVCMRNEWVSVELCVSGGRGTGIQDAAQAEPCVAYHQHA